MIRKIILSTFLFLIIPSIAFSQIVDIKEAINKAGRQRMLSQRIAKDYLYIGLNKNVVEAKLEMEESIDLFEFQLKELLIFAPNSNIRMEFERIKFSWAYFKKLTSTPPSKKNAVKIINYSQRLLKETNKAVQLLTQFSKTKTNDLINISGKQRMYAQQIALYFAAYNWRVPHRDIISKFNFARNTFLEALSTLLANTSNSEEINQALNEIKTVFFIEKDFEVKKDYPLDVMYTSMNSISSKMNTITQMYENK